MINTLTPIGLLGKGVYRHAGTGFTLHDISDVADAIDCNGFFACDMVKNTWAWILGEDLFVEVYKRGATSLSTLASNLLGKKMAYAVDQLNVGYTAGYANEANARQLYMPGMFRETFTMGADIRVFGIITNAQAGRGMSTNLHDCNVKNTAPNSAGGYAPSDVDARAVDAVLQPYHTAQGLGASTVYFGVPALGRVVVTIPLLSWDKFLSEWKSALPNIDRSEVQELADGTIAKFRALFATEMFHTPSVRVPITLRADGTAWIDTNPTPSYCHAPNGTGSTKGTQRMWNIGYCPTIIDENGWWLTNPLAPTGETHSVVNMSIRGIDSDFLNPGGVIEAPAAATHLYSQSQITGIDTVDLFKILGGAYPRVDTVKHTFTTAALIQRCFKHRHADSPLPAQGGAQSDADYAAACASTQARSNYGMAHANWGHWNLAGQPAVVATTLLDLSMQDKTLPGQYAISHFSGNMCRTLRLTAGSAVYNQWTTLDLLTSPELYIRSQYR